LRTLLHADGNIAAALQGGIHGSLGKGGLVGTCHGDPSPALEGEFYLAAVEAEEPRDFAGADESECPFVGDRLGYESSFLVPTTGSERERRDQTDDDSDSSHSSGSTPRLLVPV
jgi:hypothetical protein